MNIPGLAGMTEKRDAAYEIKFVVPASVGEAVVNWARMNLSPDPNASSSSGDGYAVNSLYFDTSSLDVYLRKGSYGKAKYRVRRYGHESAIFLERKLKSRGLVSKRRSKIPDQEIARLAEPEPDPAWVGCWFRRRLDIRQLLPQCQIRYDRVARVGLTPDGPIRMTVDSNIRAFPTRDYMVFETGVWRPLLTDRCIVELKFRANMPPQFKNLLEELSLTPQPVSKYRMSIQAFGLDPEAGNGHPASHNGHTTAHALVGNGTIEKEPPLPVREA